MRQGRAYRFRAWVKSSADFSGKWALWVVGDAKHGAVAVNGLGTDGLWQQATATGIHPKTDRLAVPE